MSLEIVARHEAPGRGPAGLAWDGRHLWHSDYREGRIYQLNESAEVVGSLTCPGNLGGLAWDGSALWQALYDEGMLRCINPETNDFDQTVDLSERGWLSGVAWAGDCLWVVAQQTGDILAVDRDTGSVQRRFAGPVAIGDIDYAADALWLSVASPMVYEPDGMQFVWQSSPHQYALLKLDTGNGREIKRYTLSGLYTGLAWGPRGHLWLASAADGCLYEARLTDD